MYYDDRHNIIIKELNKDSGKVSDISDNNASKMVGKKNDDEYRIASPVLLNLCDKFLIMYEQSKTEQMKIIYDYLKQKFEKLISRYPDSFKNIKGSYNSPFGKIFLQVKEKFNSNQ